METSRDNEHYTVKILLLGEFRHFKCESDSKDTRRHVTEIPHRSCYKNRNCKSKGWYSVHVSYLY